MSKQDQSATSNAPTDATSVDTVQASPTTRSQAVFQPIIEPEEGLCYHCGESLPNKIYYTTILAKPRPMCCMGCHLASQSIIEAGLESYYLDRSEISRTAPMPEQLSVLTAYDHKDFQQKFVFKETGNCSSIDLSVAGIRCAACGWLIEKQIIKLGGIKQVAVNIGSQRLRVVWDDDVTPVSQILSSVEKLGYQARPFRQDTHSLILAAESKKMLVRLGVAALGSMQAMMYAISVYLGDFSGIDLEYKDYFRLIGFIVSLPVVLYAAYPFYRSAYLALRSKTVNMDVPVSIALLLTFTASTYATFSHANTGETYFDSVCMFIAFLLVGRYLEVKARQKSSQSACDLMLIDPVLTHKEQTDSNGNTIMIDVPRHLLQVGDVIHIRPGESIPCNGKVLRGNASVSEALLTGESQPLEKHEGDTILGGSQNYAQPFVMVVTEAVEMSQEALLDRLIGRALSERPKAALQADRIAKWFIARVLVLAFLVYVVWYFIDPQKALWATIAVLVATCPCALSLATPMVLTTATNWLASKGFLLTRGHVLETFASATHIIFDKTGTLTQGKPEWTNTQLFANTANPSSYDALVLAAALEQSSNHPIAKAILNKASSSFDEPLPKVLHINHIVGGGIEGIIDGITYRLGHAEFVGLNQTSQELEVFLAYQQSSTPDNAQNSKNSWQVLASFQFADLIRKDALETIAYLKNAGLSVWMLSGDPSTLPQTIGKQLDIDVVRNGQLPQDKVNAVKQLQADGHIVAMVGDGVNDGPVLASANMSIAMSSGADLALMTADSVLLNDSLLAITSAHRMSLRSEKLIAQNLKWAFFYNLIVIIPAALGLIPPWLAAIGMSTSSLLVVLNARRTGLK